MAWRNNYDPDRRPDSSYGLIMRLNYLWSKCDNTALTGDFEAWNWVLDRIFSNLLYKDPLEVLYNADGTILDVSMSDKDAKIWDELNKKVIEARRAVVDSKTKEEYRKAKVNMYQALFLKEVGLRKFMYELKLYLKDIDSNPARSMWGG